MRKILVVDDDTVVRHIIGRMLRRASYEVILAANGREGVAAFRAQHPDLVITDMIMPELDGIETIRQIRAEKPDANIIAISGGAPTGKTDYSYLAQRLGASMFLTKPFDPDEFLATVARCLDGERTTEQRATPTAA